MRNLTTLKAFTVSALLTASTLFVNASAAPVFFHNDAGASGIVDIYVDGTLVFDDIAPDNAMMFPQELASGRHEVIVTPYNRAPGVQDVLRTTIEIEHASSYHLTLGNTSAVYLDELTGELTQAPWTGEPWLSLDTGLN
ncbi:DUF4397 domain-containing protein [Deinococcus deserti]|uniref:DUF4397 domain-containing protein n=1 Tax=Deinococcus deserti (strain DSM 17065 / CIP 109153 / LMG 22923 / VCD115) TaxID=546414 RepID=C1D258_DEIDV|nr:DUF4397 domain-containing protein [Deinococcus deserti]ACO47497.1 Conserved hypothetical protein, precursor [Deinococcus deserti VCD115]